MTAWIKAEKHDSKRNRFVISKGTTAWGLRHTRHDESLRFVLNQQYVTGFTIGFSSPKQIDDIAQRIERVRAVG